MASDNIKLGIIGMSDGNGHPYSWSAICNGYSEKEMSNCPFPVIPEYLNHQKWPEAKITNAEVVCIWTQDMKLSNHIAAAAKIPTVLTDFRDMINQVDAILLARDDAENHWKFVNPIIEAGVPIFIDKPLALSVGDAERIFSMEKFPGQIYSCSAMRYSSELLLTEEEKVSLGTIKYIEGVIPKSWEKYSVHVIESIISGQPNRGNIRKFQIINKNQIKKMFVSWDNLEAEITTYGKYKIPFELRYYCENGFIIKQHVDSFNSFKSAIIEFLNGFLNRHISIKRSETLEIISIIEGGIKHA